MARFLRVEDGVVIGVLEFPDVSQERGSYVIPDPTAKHNVGDAVAEDERSGGRYISETDQLLLSELFRLANEVNALKSASLIAIGAYTDTLKSQLLVDTLVTEKGVVP